jgi:hypothetical protein
VNEPQDDAEEAPSRFQRGVVAVIGAGLLAPLVLALPHGRRVMAVLIILGWARLLWWLHKVAGAYTEPRSPTEDQPRTGPTVRRRAGGAQVTVTERDITIKVNNVKRGRKS